MEEEIENEYEEYIPFKKNEMEEVEINPIITEEDILRIEMEFRNLHM
jgi:hypothetical protein